MHPNGLREGDKDSQATKLPMGYLVTLTQERVPFRRAMGSESKSIDDTRSLDAEDKKEGIEAVGRDV